MSKPMNLVRSVVSSTSFLGKYFPGNEVQVVSDKLEKEGKVMIEVRTFYKRAVKTEVFANFNPTKQEIDSFLFGMTMVRILHS